MQDLKTPWETAPQLQVVPQLQVIVTVDGPRCVVRLSGELDMATAAQLRDALDLVCEGRHRLVVIDLGGLRFLSLIGLQILAEAQQTLQAAGCGLVLANPDAITTRVLALTGLDQVFCLVPEAGHPKAEVVLGGGPVIV